VSYKLMVAHGSVNLSTAPDDADLTVSEPGVHLTICTTEPLSLTDLACRLHELGLEVGGIRCRQPTEVAHEDER
jgi:hypothetical protein